jgi:hypothetical protein
MSFLNIFGRNKRDQVSTKSEHQLMIEPDHNMMATTNGSLLVNNQHKAKSKNKGSP